MPRLFRRRETRSDGGGYTDLVLSAVELAAAGETVGAAATAAVETASGLLARSLSQATVVGSPWAQRAVTAGWLHRVGTDIISYPTGHLSQITGDGDDVRLVPAQSWTWYGAAPDRSDWRVLATIPRPTGSETLTIPETAVVRMSWAPSRSQPWYGRSPLSSAKLTSELMGALERSLGREAAGQVGHLVAMPRARTRDTSGETFDGRLQSLDDLAGRTMAISPATGFDPAAMPSQSNMTLRAERIGANPPEALVMLHRDVHETVLAACGVPPSLVGTGTGTDVREALRRYISMTVEPIARILAEELTRKLETQITFNFDRLAATDLASKARAVRSLVASGWTPREAARACGLDEPGARHAPPQPGAPR